MAIVVKNVCVLDGQNAGKTSDALAWTERRYLTFNTPVVDPVQALEDSGYIAGQINALYPNLKLAGASCTPFSGSEWFFDLEWSSNRTINDDNPLNFKPIIKYSSWSFQRVVEVDKKDGSIIENTAGDKFDPPPLETITYPTISVTVRESSANIDRVEDVGSINSAAFNLVGITIPTNCAMLANYQPEPVTDPETGDLRFNNTFTFQLNFNKDQEDDSVVIGFKTQIANAGFNELKNGETVRQRMKDLNQEEYSTPQFLKGGIGSDKGEYSGVANYLTYTVNDEVNMSSYGLPTSYPSY